MRIRGMVYLWTLCILLLPAWSAWGQPFYTVTDLGSMIPRPINEDGVIVGSASIAGVQTPVSWVAGHQTPLATLGVGGRADAITRTLEAVGYVLTTPTATQQASQWDAQGTLHDLGTLGGLFATIFDVNHSGIGVGFSTTASGASVAVYATAAGGVQPLPMLQGVVELSGHILAPWIGCNAYAINDVPQAVGSCWTSAPNPSLTVEHAVSWQNDSSVTDLNARIDPRAGWVLSHAQDMNDVGQIVGQGWLNGQVRGILLTPADETTALAAYEVVKDVRETLPAHVRERLPVGLFHR